MNNGSTEQIEGGGNIIMIVEKSGKSEILPSGVDIPGLQISLRGENNVVKIHKPFRFINSSIIVDAKDSCTEILENSVCNTLCVMNNGGYEKRNLRIGRNFGCWGCEILLNGRENGVFIGDDCVFSKEIRIMNGDGHSIWGRNSPPKPLRDIRIGDHVWLGMGVYVLKNVSIASGAIVGAASVVSSDLSKENSSYGGNPCKLIRESVFWKK